MAIWKKEKNLGTKLDSKNSPYFCVFKYARAVEQKVWNEAENGEWDWGETLLILLRHALPISLLILRKKPTVLQSKTKSGTSAILAEQPSCTIMRRTNESAFWRANARHKEKN